MEVGARCELWALIAVGIIMSLIIRNAKPHDFPRISELIQRSAKVLQLQYYKESEIETALELVDGIETLIDSNSYFVAENENSIVGCGGFYIDSLESKEAEIRAFFVDPEFSRQGIAAQILSSCETHCLAIGVESLHLTSTLSGEPFYKKYGFLEVERFKKILSNGQCFELIKMLKNMCF